MSNVSDRLFTPFLLPNGIELKNRLIMAPMTTCAGFYDGTVNRELVDYYQARAGSIGAIVVESCFIANKGTAFPGAIGIDHDNKMAGLAKIARAIKDKGSKAILQIYHGGRMVSPALIGGQAPVAPSAVAAPREGAPEPVALSAAAVEDMIAKFGDAVHRAIQAGFDGVEIHGANTYLVQQFYSPHSNRRTDKWGGSRDKRARFPLAVLDIAHHMADRYAGDGFIIGYRFSPEEIEEPGIRFDDSLYLLEKLAERGLDYLHFSLGHVLNSSIVDTADTLPLIRKYIAGRSGVLAKVPVIGVGGVVNRSDADAALEHGYDLIAVGRACIAYPDWADRIMNGQAPELYIDSTRREALMIPEPLWRFSLVEAMIRDMSITSKKFKAGIYQEKLPDDNRKLVMNVILETDRIKDITLISRSEPDPDFMACFEALRSRILAANSPHVDAVTGATARSEAVKKAVSKALMKSSRAALLARGGSEAVVLQRYDVVVVGSGGAGLAAAIQAADDGASVLIVEKMPVIGGNTVKASAGMNAAETRFQKMRGIADSKALFYEETMKGGGNRNNPDLLWYFVEHAPQAIEWLAGHGIELSDITTTGGMSVDRTHRPADGSAVGGYLVSSLMKNVSARNIDVMLDTSVTEILRENGKVAAVRLFNDENEEQVVLAGGVIVATGGFSANKQMVVQYRPDLDGFVTTNHEGATGSGITLLERLGAATVDLDAIQIHPTVEQTSSYLISESVRGGGGILVSQAARRFFNEMETRDKVSAAIMQLPEKYAYIILDEQIRAKNRAVEKYLECGFVISADSLKVLAEKLVMDPRTLSATLKRYNTFVGKQYDEDFGRRTALRQPIEQGPFYAIRIAPGVHHTMGGVVINTEAAVLNREQQVIEGVWAAGEVVGGIHGANRIGGNAVADIIIFGIQAGRNAAAFTRR